MWRVRSLGCGRSWIDGLGGDGGERACTSILGDGVTLANAAELLEVRDAMQVIICGCGITQCASGGWVRFRRFGDDVIWIPDARRDDPEFAPPGYYHERGAPRISAELWAALRERLPMLPEPRSLPPLCARELLELLQEEAPGDVLGRSPEPPRLRRSGLLNVMSGAFAEEVEAVDRCVRRYAASSAPVVCARGDEQAAMIDFLLDAPDAELWSAFGRVGDEVVVVVDGAPVRIDGA